MVGCPGFKYSRLADSFVGASGFTFILTRRFDARHGPQPFNCEVAIAFDRCMDVEELASGVAHAHIDK
jgi:hypothetical protein